MYVPKVAFSSSVESANSFLSNNECKASSYRFCVGYRGCSTAKPSLSLVMALPRLRYNIQQTRQSGQREIDKIYAVKRLLDLHSISIRWVWVSAEVTLEERVIAKKAARQELLSTVMPVRWAARSTIIARLKANTMKKVALPLGVGKAIKELDCALSGPHTKMIYDNLTKDEAKVIAQLRTGDA